MSCATQGRTKAGLVALAMACALAFAGNAGAEQSPNRISAVRVAEEGSQTVVTVVGSARPAYNVYSLRSPDRLVVDLSGSRIEGLPSHLRDATSQVEGIALSERSSRRGLHGRLVISLRGEVAYRTRVRGNRLEITLTSAPAAPRSAAEAESEAARRARSEREREEALLATARRARLQAEEAVRTAEAQRRRVMQARSAEEASLQREREARRRVAGATGRQERRAAERDLQRARTEGARLREQLERLSTSLAEAQQVAQQRQVAARRAATAREDAEARATVEAAARAQAERRATAAEQLAEERGEALSVAQRRLQKIEARATRARDRADAAETAQREAAAAATSAAEEARAAIAARDEALETARRADGDSRTRARQEARRLARAAAQARAEAARAQSARERAERAATKRVASAERVQAQLAEARQALTSARRDTATAEARAERAEASRDEALTRASAAETRAAKALEARRGAERQASEATKARRTAERSLEVALRQSRGAEQLAARRTAALGRARDHAAQLEAAATEARTVAERAEASRAAAETRAARASEQARAAAEAQQSAAAAARDASSGGRQEARREARRLARAAADARRAAASARAAQTRAEREAARRGEAAGRAETLLAGARTSLERARAEATEAQQARRRAEARAETAEQARTAALARAETAERAQQAAERRATEAQEARVAAERAAREARTVAARTPSPAEPPREVARGDGPLTQEEIRLRRLAAMRGDRGGEARSRGRRAAPSSEGEAAARRPAVRDVRFSADDDVSRVTVDLTGRVEYTLARDADGNATIELHGATLPGLLERTLDVVEHDGPVASVSSFSREDSGDAVIEVDVSDGARSRVRRDGNRIVVEFRAPPAAAREEEPAEGRRASRRGRDEHGRPASVVVAREDIGEYQYGEEEAAGFVSAVPLEHRRSRRRRAYSGRRIDLDFKDADIHNILRLLSDVGRVNIIAADDVSGTITIKMRNVPWDQALDVILRSKGLGMQRDGNLIRVAPLTQLEKEREMELARRKHAIQLAPLETRIIPISYAMAADLLPRAQELLSARGSISTDERTNVLIARDLEGSLDQIEELIRALDTQTPQVLIEARIVEATSAYERELGIQWGGDFVSSAATGNPTGIVFPNSIGLGGGATDGETPIAGLGLTPGAQPNPNFAVNLPAAVGTGSGGALALTMGSVDGNAHLNIRLSAMEDTGTLRIISSPRILTMDNAEAHIEQGTLIPYSQVSAQGVQTAFQEAKLNLTVTPHVTADGSVLMKVAITRDEPDFNNTGARGDPTILKREAETQFLVRDGHTVVIGGIYTRTTGVNYGQVPGLARIPILGWLFKNRSDSDRRSEMLIFITPRIVNRAESIGR